MKIKSVAVCRLITLCLLLSGLPAMSQTITLDQPEINLVKNGDFEQGKNNSPDNWMVSGEPKVKQGLVSDIGRSGSGFSAKLICIEFKEINSSSHAMIAQQGVVEISKGKWYRLTFWAKAVDIKGSVIAGLSNTQTWKDTGLYKEFYVLSKWKKYEVSFQAKDDLASKVSRLNFSFKSTGILWLDNVEMTEIKETKVQWNPQLNTKDITNYIPNSSFECGNASWGSYSPEIKGEENIYRLIGELDNTTAAHGKTSLLLDLSEKILPVQYLDYPASKRAIKCVLAANCGWIPVEKGNTYTLSAFMKADKPGVTGHLLVREVEGVKNRADQRKNAALTTKWARYSFTIKAAKDYVFVCAGFYPGEIKEAKIWIDAVQFEKGEKTSEYQTALPLEIAASTEAPGNIFTCEQIPFDMPLQIKCFNNTGTPQNAKTIISVKDFFDKEVICKEIEILPQANSGESKTVLLPMEKYGFYNITVSLLVGGILKEDLTQKLRCAVLKPVEADSRFGMNQVYPWTFLLDLAKKAGISWWRNWSVQWDIVQEKSSASFNFAKPDVQVDYVIKEEGKVLVLFPFPSSSWSRETGIDPVIKKLSVDMWETRLDPAMEAARAKWSEGRLNLSAKPENEEEFVRYIRESVKHYKSRIKVYHILNEPVCTTCSLPAKLGYKTEDYIHILELAYKTVKEEQPDAIVVGGMGAPAATKWPMEFIKAGGLKYVDVFDMHNYPFPLDPEQNSEAFIELWKTMKEQKEAKPIWLTELGCYADDDPAQTPLVYGDTTMRKSWHASEADSSAWFVKFATLLFANGGEKIFLHAGTCSEVNGVDVSGVLFKYGGEPRKILSALSAMANMLPVEAKFNKKVILEDKVSVYWFTTPAGEAGVSWAEDGELHNFKQLPDAKAYDIMGNPIPDAIIEITDMPVYFKKVSSK